MAQSRSGHKSKPGPKPTDYRYRPGRRELWFKQSWFTPIYKYADWAAQDLADLKRLAKETVRDRRERGDDALLLTDRMMHVFVNDREQARDLVRAVLDLRIVRPWQLDPRDLPGRIPIVLIDNVVARVELRGEIRQTFDGKPELGDVMVIITSKADKLTLALKPDVGGNPLPYLRTLVGPIRVQLPKLYRRLAHLGLFANMEGRSSDRVYLTRLVLAIQGLSVDGRREAPEYGRLRVTRPLCDVGPSSPRRDRVG